MTTCPDCNGPLAQAFFYTPHYKRCRRCGHVFSDFNAATMEEIIAENLNL